MSLAILRDLRFATRSLSRSPGLTFTAIITLGLGIGANTSMFSVLNGYMLRPMPYADHADVDRIYRATSDDARGGVSPADYLDLKSEMSAYGAIAAYASAGARLSEPGRAAEVAPGMRASANLFSILGTKPQLGRSFREEEETAGQQHVLVISHRCWQNRFGADAHIIGRSVRVDGEPHEIVGVLPAAFSDWRHLAWVDVFRPLSLGAEEARDRSSTRLSLVGRRASAVTRDQAEAFIANFGRRLAADFPADHAETRWRSLPLDDSFLPPVGQAMIAMLIGLSSFVLLIACSNLANLLLARTMARARELAVRSAIGASRAQVLRPLIVESLLLAGGGGVCALFVARWTFDWMAKVSLSDAGAAVFLTFDWHVLAWAFGSCLFTALVFGIAPALFVLRLDPNRTLKSGSRGTTGDRGHRRFRQLLIVGQFALAMVLLAGASLFVQGLHELNNRRYGWESDSLVTATLELPSASYPGGQEISDFQHRALERLTALPGVASASVSYSLPFFGLSGPRRYVVAGRETPEPGREPAAVMNGVSSRYFETVGTRLLRGRLFSAADTLESPRVFIVNETMARGLFGDENPIGRKIAQAGGQALEWGEIVGVVADVQWVFPDRPPVTYQLYQPMDQEPRPINELAVRAAAGIRPATLIDGIRTTMTSLDLDLPVRKLQPAAARIARANYTWSVLGTMLSALALLGLGLACLGVSGVVARAVAQRTGEFGIRRALGAQAGDITRLVLLSGAKLAFVGSALGLVGAFGIARLFGAAFPSMQTRTAPVLAGVTLLLAAVAQLACYIPARRASRVSPTEALRAE